MVEFRTPEQNRTLGIEPARLNRFDMGKLSQQETAILMQDVVESGVLTKLPSKWLRNITYFVAIGFCQMEGTPLH